MPPTQHTKNSDYSAKANGGKQWTIKSQIDNCSTYWSFFLILLVMHTFLVASCLPQASAGKSGDHFELLASHISSRSRMLPSSSIFLDFIVLTGEFLPVGLASMVLSAYLLSFAWQVCMLKCLDVWCGEALAKTMK